jgi:hypothetical protein
MPCPRATPFGGGSRAKPRERFRDERLLPAFKELGMSRDDLTWSDFEAHSFIAGDLSGASQSG